ncbi:hypothetical protein PM082_010211 [Marasmius tenuissimus]|nr:hypothetical protein PM082_010211 [Marasmius tenuissimus]
MKLCAEFLQCIALSVALALLLCSSLSLSANMFASTTKAFAVVAAFLAVSGQVGVGATPAGVNDVEARASYYTGDATYYDPGAGIGACGKQSSASQLVAAVAAPVFDNYPGAPPNPNNNPICKKQAKVTYGSKSVTVNVVDRCPGCGNTGIDLSPTAFSKLAPTSVGRLKGVKWRIL